MEHLKEFEKNIHGQRCPGKLQIVLIRTTIEKFFDVLEIEGLQNKICGFEFNIHTSTVQPIYCIQLLYGPYKSQVITAPVEMLEKKNIVKDNEGLWGSRTGSAVIQARSSTCPSLRVNFPPLLSNPVLKGPAVSHRYFYLSIIRQTGA